MDLTLCLLVTETDLPEVTDRFYHMIVSDTYRKWQSEMVIHADCESDCKINYYTIAVTTTHHFSLVYSIRTRKVSLIVCRKYDIYIYPIKKSLKIPKGQSEFVYRRRTDNTMAKRKSTKGQTTIYKTCI